MDHASAEDGVAVAVPETMQVENTVDQHALVDASDDITEVERALRVQAKRFMGEMEGKSFKSSRKLMDVEERGGLFSTAERVTADGGNAQESASPAMQKVVEVSIQWVDLQYSVPIGRGAKRRDKVILDQLSGSCTPGHLLAVMGPTGCGKTSLINALAGRLAQGGELNGDILVNGQPRQKNFRNVSAYVMQDDVLFHNLSVRETFLVAAKLRLPEDMPLAAKNRVVDSVIRELGLAKAANTHIGNSFVRGVSGGERKRVNIGVELLANPSIVFLDEPTSGLDAFQAQNVMESLWNLAHGGRSVVSTIHQPRSSIYTMFDLLLLLSEGKTMFFGPANQAVAYFSRWGFGCPATYNPADFFLDAVSMDYRSASAEQASRTRVQLFSKAYRLSAAGDQDLAALDVPTADNLKGIADDFSFATGWTTQLRVLFGRAWMQVMRDKFPMIVTLVQMFVIGLLLGIVYVNVKKDQKGIQDLEGILFFITIFVAFSNMFPVINAFPSEKAIVNRERASKSYQVSPYYLSKLVAEAPFRIFTSLLFSCIVYWLAGLNPGARQFFVFCGICILESLCAQGLGLAISAFCRNEKLALALAPACLVIMLLFGGFYINKDSIPEALRWICYLSFLYYTFLAFATNNFAGDCCWTCDPVCVGYSATGACTSYSTSIQTSDCLRTGADILNRLTFSGWHAWEGCLGMVGLAILYNVIGYYGLHVSKPRFLPLTHIGKKDCRHTNSVATDVPNTAVPDAPKTV